MRKEKGFYQIGEVSKLCNISIKTLRYYDEIELLMPEKIDPYSGYRYYSNKQLTLVLVIKHFKEAGFPLKEIKQLLGREDLEYNKTKIKEKCKEIDDRINDLIRLKEKLNFCLYERKKQEYTKKEAQIEIKYIPETYIAYLRSPGVISVDEFTVRYCRLMSLIEKNKFHTTKNVMALYYNSCIEFENNDKQEYDIEVCAQISETKEMPGLVRKFGGFRAVSSIHYGSYDNMIEVYRKMVEYINKNGYEICGPAIDNYIVDIISTCDENNYVTELLIPIK